MTDSPIVARIKRFFPHSPTTDQAAALESLADFLASREADSAFLLRGYAGTGKSSLVAALVRMLDELKQPVVLLAPTGRAARRLALYAAHPAYTIHKIIYRQKAFSGFENPFDLQPNLRKHTLFLVDEASMIASGLSSADAAFGSGRLLDDLIRFVYAGEGCRLLLTGDSAQLPPVGETRSPALDEEELRAYGLQTGTSELTQVVRQESESGILWNATLLRRYIAEAKDPSRLRLRATGFADIIPLPGNELIEALAESYAREGEEETIVLTRSNRRAVLYNQGIRRTILDLEEELCSGDRIMIARNHYYDTEEDVPPAQATPTTPNRQPGTEARQKKMDFLANGDIAIVRRVRRERELYGFRFADVTISFPDYHDEERDEILLLDTLAAETPALSREDQEKLFQAVLEDYADLSRKADRMKQLRENPYYNALQAKYGYAVTCHKAQGGQWAHVYLDAGYLPPEQLTPDYLRWLYTAVTRATKRLYLINYPSDKLQ